MSSRGSTARLGQVMPAAAVVAGLVMVLAGPGRAAAAEHPAGASAARGAVIAAGVQQLSHPVGAVVDRSGNVVIADTFQNLVRVVAESTGTFYGQAMTVGNIYTVAGDGTGGYSGDGGPAAAAEIDADRAVAVDGSGNLVIADTDNNRIRVVAGSTGTFYGQAMTAGHIYTVAGDGTAGYAGDGGPSAAAELAGPAGVAIDSYGNVVLSDTGNSRVRLVAASTGRFYNRQLTAGNIYTLAGDGVDGFRGDGGWGALARLGRPRGLAVDAAGNLLITDTDNSRIRVVPPDSGTFYGQAMKAGHIYRIAGDGGTAYAHRDGFPALKAPLKHPDGVAVDPAGNVLIADNKRVRLVAEHTTTMYGQAMTTGDIYTISGTGSKNYDGLGGPASAASIGHPTDVTADSAGNVLIITGFLHPVLVVAGSTGTFYGKPMITGHIYAIPNTRGGPA